MITVSLVQLWPPKDRVIKAWHSNRPNRVQSTHTESAAIFTGPRPVGYSLQMVHSFIHLNSDIIVVLSIDGQISKCISETWFTFDGLRQLGCYHGFRPSFERRVYAATMATRPLYDCETWPIKSNDLSRLSVRQHPGLWLVAGMSGQHHVSEERVRR